MRFWNFTETDDGAVELRIFGEIIDDSWAWIYEWLGEPYASPNKFRAKLEEHKGKDIVVRIDSPGGDVFAAVGIHTALMEHKGRVTVKIDGKAFSAASIIAMAGKEILMSPGSMMLVHNPWSYTEGEAKDMRHVADILDEIKEAIMNVYELRTGRTREEISAIMDEETPMAPQKAIEEKFADGMLYTETAAAIKNHYLATYRPMIQNSLKRTITKALEIKEKQDHAPEEQQNQLPEECPVNRAFDRRRISVREKIQNRRKKAHG